MYPYTCIYLYIHEKTQCLFATDNVVQDSLNVGEQKKTETIRQEWFILVMLNIWKKNRKNKYLKKK